MKKYNEIIAEMEQARKNITEEKQEAHHRATLIYGEALRAGNEERAQEARAELAKARAEAEAEKQKNLYYKIVFEILRDNAKRAKFAEIVGAICDTWNKYEGKPCGEKTAQKIREEIHAKTGDWVYIGNKYGNAEITATFYDAPNPRPFQKLEISGIWNEGEGTPALDGNNKILRISPDVLALPYCGEYVENAEAHAKELQEAHKKAQEAWGEVEKATAIYNKLTRGNIQHINPREGVKNWII